MYRFCSLIASVTFCFTFLVVSIISGEAKAQNTNSPSMNSQSEVPLAAKANTGVVLINQTAALKGKITPGDTPGFPVTISQPGSYLLSSNLTVPSNTNGIEVQADNVTIDLNGFQITGGGAGFVGITDNLIARKGITVRNGNIENFGLGIVLDRSSRCNIEQIGVHVSGAGIGVGSNSIVSRNTIDGSDTATRGITADEKSIVSGNTVSLSLEGIVTGQGSIISGNTVSGGSTGVTAVCPSNLVGNTVIENTENIVENGTGCTRANNNPAP